MASEVNEDRRTSDLGPGPKLRVLSQSPLSTPPGSSRRLPERQVCAPTRPFALPRAGGRGRPEAAVRPNAARPILPPEAAIPASTPLGRVGPKAAVTFPLLL